MRGRSRSGATSRSLWRDGPRCCPRSHGDGDEYHFEQLWQKIDVTDFHEITDRTDIGDDQQH